MEPPPLTDFSVAPDRLRLLLIEDEPDHAELVQAYLADTRDPEVTVRHAPTVGEGVEALGEARRAGAAFDIVLTDQRLPDSDYWQTVPTVVAAAGDVPVVALTSIGDLDVALSAIAQGAQDYLVKSELSAEMLRRTLRYAVERTRHAAELRATNEALRQTLQHVRQMQAQLVEQEKLAGLGRLLAGVAHEFRNPLHLTVGFAEAAAHRAEELAAHLGPDLTGEAAEDLASVLDNARKAVQHGHRTDGVMQQMVEHARGVAGQLQPVDLHAALNAALARAVPPEAGVAVERAYDAALAGEAGYGMNEALKRVLYNVVENASLAVSARDGDARVRVTTERRDDGERGLAAIVVEDNGPGIADEALPFLFEPFFTAWETQRRVGLGLTLAHNIVSSHGGWIEAGPSELGGARLQIVLPLAPLPPVTADGAIGTDAADDAEAD